ncbi:MAG: DNA repair protein RecO [Deltaproteobacteria bacterium]|nr:DNA repair protein RecO [Deltaproteobacteria bacterium]
MNINSSASIIMRVKDYGESDLLITFFTPAEGKIKGIAKGARRSKARFVNCLDIFSLVNLEYSQKKKESLHFIHSGKLLDAFPGLRKDYNTLIKASYMIELTEMLFPWQLPDRGMFEILKKSLETLDRGENPGIVPVCFELAAMSLGGYGINIEKCSICGRKYMGHGTAVFRPDKGGIACMKCQEVTKLTPAISPDTVMTIKEIQTGLIKENFEINHSAAFLSEIKPVLKLHREYRLEHKPKSSNYLE